jgi:hypothetical protein
MRCLLQTKLQSLAPYVVRNAVPTARLVTSEAVTKAVVVVAQVVAIVTPTLVVKLLLELLTDCNGDYLPGALELAGSTPGNKTLLRWYSCRWCGSCRGNCTSRWCRNCFGWRCWNCWLYAQLWCGHIVSLDEITHGVN